MTLFKKFLLLSLSLGSLCCLHAPARKIKSRLPTKSSVSEIDRQNVNPECIILSENDSTGDFDKIKNRIRFYGFDKTVAASMESFFIVNNSDSLITHIAVDIDYFDMQGRQLHQQSASFDCNIPPRQTRRHDIKSWDTQKAFYFHQSASPRRQATPFDVTIRLTGLSLICSSTFSSDVQIVD